MGRLNTEAEVKSPNPVMHFLHDHPLEITIVPIGKQVGCSCCNIDILPNKSYYACRSCKFNLHGICFNLPRIISHPADPNHNLFLVQSPSFDCQACGNHDSGFMYACDICLKKYHPLCTLRPLTTFHESHPDPLNLEFSCPYEGTKGFLCNICRKAGFDQWLYSCRPCGFDVHLNCIKYTSGCQARNAASASGHSFPASRKRSASHPQALQNASPYNQPYNDPNMLQQSFSPSNPYTANQPVLTSQHGPVTTSSRSPINNTSAPTFAPQNSPNIGYAHQGNGFNNTMPPGGNNIYSNPSYGNNQPIILTPNGAPMTVFQANQVPAYATPMSYTSNQNEMSGMTKLLAAGVVVGAAEELGKEMFQGLAGGSGDLHSSSSSNPGGSTDIVDCWIGDFDGN